MKRCLQVVGRVQLRPERVAQRKRAGHRAVEVDSPGPKLTVLFQLPFKKKTALPLRPFSVSRRRPKTVAARNCGCAIAILDLAPASAKWGPGKTCGLRAPQPRSGGRPDPFLEGRKGFLRGMGKTSISPAPTQGAPRINLGYPRGPGLRRRVWFAPGPRSPQKTSSSSFC